MVLSSRFIALSNFSSAATGEQVGGLWDPETMSYFSGASPCSSQAEDSKNLGLILGLSIGGAVLIALVLGALFLHRRSAGKQLR